MEVSDYFMLDATDFIPYPIPARDIVSTIANDAVMAETSIQFRFQAPVAVETYTTEVVNGLS